MQVLKAGENSTLNQLDNKSEKKPEVNGGGGITPEKKIIENKLAPPTKKQRILEKISYVDLKGDETDGTMPQLQLSKVSITIHKRRFVLL